jgi:mannose-6-phosphate isomerase-like protein (cupin superfamily)
MGHNARPECPIWPVADIQRAVSHLRTSTSISKQNELSIFPKCLLRRRLPVAVAPCWLNIARGGCGGLYVRKITVGRSPSGNTGREDSRHPGEEVIYVVQGTWEYNLDGQPPVTIETGQSFLTPYGVVHGVRNIGSDTAIGLSTWVAEKGKPLTALAK